MWLMMDEEEDEEEEEVKAEELGLLHILSKLSLNSSINFELYLRMKKETENRREGGCCDDDVALGPPFIEPFSSPRPAV